MSTWTSPWSATATAFESLWLTPCMLSPFWRQSFIFCLQVIIFQWKLYFFPNPYNIHRFVCLYYLFLFFVEPCRVWRTYGLRYYHGFDYGCYNAHSGGMFTEWTKNKKKDAKTKMKSLTGLIGLQLHQHLHLAIRDQKIIKISLYWMPFLLISSIGNNKNPPITDKIW